MGQKFAFSNKLKIRRGKFAERDKSYFSTTPKCYS